MASQLSPFVEANYGWPYGSNGWNDEMDANLVKFSYLFDRNIDSIVSSLPAISNGSAYFNTTDNRLYFDVGGQRYSSSTPKWFEVTLRSSGQVYQFDGTILNLGSTVTAYTDALRSDLSNSSNPVKGSYLVGFLQDGTNATGRTASDKLKESFSFRDFGAVGDGVVDDTVAVQAAFNAAKLANVVLVGEQSDRFLISSPITCYYPASVRMNGGRFVTSPSFSGGTSSVLIRNGGVAGDSSDKVMEIGLQGPYGGESIPFPPNIPIGTYTVLDGIDISGTSQQVNNTNLILWVEGFRDNIIVKGSNWWLLRFKDIHCGKFWRRGISFNRITNAGEMISFNGGLFFNGINSAGTAIAIYEDGTTNIDTSFYGVSMDYCDTFLDAASGTWKFIGCHPENNNINPQFTARNTPGQSLTRLVLDESSPVNGPGGSGHISPAPAGGRAYMIGLVGAVSTAVRGQLSQFGLFNTELIRQVSAIAQSVEFTGWADMPSGGAQSIPYAPHNLLYNGGFELGTLVPWTATSSWTVDNTTSRTGTFSAKSTAAGATYSLSQNLQVKAGELYVIQSWVKTQGISGGAVRMRIQFFASDGTTIISDDLTTAGAITTDVNFTALGGRFTVPLGATTMRVNLYVQNITGSVWFDDAGVWKLH